MGRAKKKSGAGERPANQRKRTERKRERETKAKKVTKKDTRNLDKRGKKGQFDGKSGCGGRCGKKKGAFE